MKFIILFISIIMMYLTSFSLGDELGFGESLGNLEGNRRRALNYRTGPNNIGVLPSSKLPPPRHGPIPMMPNRPMPMMQRPHPSTIVGNRLATKAPYVKKGPALMTEAASLPLGVPAFKPIPKTSEPPKAPQLINQQSQNFNSFMKNAAHPSPFQEPSPFKMPEVRQAQNYTFVPGAAPTQQSPKLHINYDIPEFQAMPSSVSRISTDNVHGTLETEIQPQNLPIVNLMGHSVEELAAAANVSVDAIKEAIFLREQQLLAQHRATLIKQQLLKSEQFNPPRTMATTTEITTTTTALPTRPPTMRPAPSSTGNKVMNAPVEYYPVGYEKNFDDNFQTKVDLPPTSFHCGDQKHFPGLYGDMDLGCMVFHVCALTDDGLVMKSFLCPESTLFDQTILKCNWWFYVDCKNTKSLYDSNIPVSKSYQLMKSLTYFSNYKNPDNDENIVDIDALKNSVSGSSNTST